MLSRDPATTLTLPVRPVPEPLLVDLLRQALDGLLPSCAAVVHYLDRLEGRR